MDNMAGGYQLSHFWNRTECSGPWYHLSVTLRPRGGMIGIPCFRFFGRAASARYVFGRTRSCMNMATEALKHIRTY